MRHAIYRNEIPIRRVIRAAFAMLTVGAVLLLLLTFTAAEPDGDLILAPLAVIGGGTLLLVAAALVLGRIYPGGPLSGQPQPGRQIDGLPFVSADGRSLHVGNVVPKPIAWWQIRDIADAPHDRWRVDWTGGAFYLSQRDPQSRRIRKAILGVLAAREHACLLPGQPAGDDVPDGALSRARMPADDAERGLSQLDEA